MRYRIAMGALFIGASIVSVAAQKRTITNAELERYRQARLNAEREYRENYERLGQPSPTELERRAEEQRKSSIETARQIMQHEVEREWMEVYRDSYYYSRPSGVMLSPRSRGGWDEFDGIAPSYLYPGYFGRRGGNRFNRQPIQSGYAAGGQYWTVGPRTAPRPLVRITRRR